MLAYKYVLFNNCIRRKGENLGVTITGIPNLAP
jgi:hypothetical protein